MAKKRFFKSKSKKGNSNNSQKKRLHPEVFKSMWVIIMASLSVLSILSFINKAGSFGELIKTILSFVAGWGMYVAPVVFLGAAIMLILSWEKSSGKSILFSAFLFFSSLLGIFALTNGTREVAIIRGGYWGYFFVWPLDYFLGKMGGLVILLTFLFISIVIGFHVRLGEILSNMRENRNLKKSSLQVKIGDEKVKKFSARGGSSFGGKNKKEKQSATTLDIKNYQQEQKEEDQLKSDKKPKASNKKEEDFIASSADGAKLKNFRLPSIDLLDEETGKPTSGDIVANANIIKRTLQNFGIDVDMSEVNVGPTVTQYTLKPAEGVKLARVTALRNDLSLALAAHPIRIEAPIPGRSLVGIEIPNKVSSQVRLGSLLKNPEFMKQDGNLTLALGRDVKGSPLYADLGRMPHMLIAGATGTGKTITLNAIMLSLLFKNPPQFLRFILIDPKRVEFNTYAGIPNLLAPIITDNNKAVNSLKWLVGEMERRFEVLAEVRARDLHSYNNNKKVIKEGSTMPYIVVIIDELADLMTSKGREVEALIVRISQMARAVGIHLILATQRPSVEIVTGLIKANITARVALQVGSQVDSRTILDAGGAESLLGRGDMLFLSPERSKPIRLQGAYISQEEISRVSKFLKEQKEKLEPADDLATEIAEEKNTIVSPNQSIDFDEVDSNTQDDELFITARDLIIKQQKASASYLQRRLKIGYARAARLLDMLEDSGVVGPADGAKPRDVYMSYDEDGNEHGDGELI